MDYYNDNDPYVAQWLRNLIEAGKLPAGEVDERSIRDVQAGDLKGFHNVHFFAGIGGWALAQALVGWPRALPLWTGSCPCQPFSKAGKNRGTDDERHLWPEFARLIAECKPHLVVGEQVASQAGRGWFAGVSADLERMGYGAAAVDLGAACIGAPHIRQRLYWVGFASGSGLERGSGARSQGQGWISRKSAGSSSGLADAGRGERQGRHSVSGAVGEPPSAPGCGEGASAKGRIVTGEREEPDATDDRSGCGPTDSPQDGDTWEESAERDRIQREVESRGVDDPDAGRYGLAEEPICSGREPAIVPGESRGVDDSERHGANHGELSPLAGGDRQENGLPRPSGGWGDFDIVACADGKHRRIEPGTTPLVDGFPGRVEQVRAYGNAIVPPLAATFLATVLEVVTDG